MSVHNTSLRVNGLEKRKNLYDEPFNFWSGIFFGLGMVAFIDEAVFHQLLHWHHFYDLSTTSVGLISDGIFHAFSWFATVVALFMVADLRKRKVWNFKRWMGSVYVGAGTFNLYDGIIQHKIMRIHQIRYHVEIFYYDVVWNVLAALMIIVGLILLKKKKTLAPLKKIGDV
ncbi:DUF2243 domain-containing protein [Lysinibacillus halotolerans]|uniref:DUF2243 domain-containing protein n=1 Tax=Lysinibacillus halotolerans TaxID=1368476 RepID=A0A3M8H8K2_9BACI|nr:DUF2243 domain-containing protein [Lysinibacillus halotolerans]RNC98628.1 DUF2243 domain-containing protein [Lysinibacillus halotolerans]